MNIVHVTSEFFPYAKTGGLADMTGALATTLADNGHDVSVFCLVTRQFLNIPMRGRQ